MAITVIEWAGYHSGRPFSFVPAGIPLAVTQFSSAAASTGFLLPATQLVSVFAYSSASPLPGAWLLLTASSGSTTVATSTSGIPISATGLSFYAPACQSTAAAGGVSTASGIRYTVLSS